MQVNQKKDLPMKIPYEHRPQSKWRRPPSGFFLQQYPVETKTHETPHVFLSQVTTHGGAHEKEVDKIKGED